MSGGGGDKVLEVAPSCAALIVSDRLDENIRRTLLFASNEILGEPMKAVWCAATFVAGVIFCFLLLSLGIVDRVDGIPGTQEEPLLSLPTYLSFISVLLTAVTVVLTGVAVGIGLVAAITFKGLKDEARTASELTSREVSKSTALEIAAEALSEVKVRAIVVELHAKAEKEREQRKEWGDDVSENEDR